MGIFKTNDIKILKKLGNKVCIRNGVGYGFISDEFLYDNGLLEIGFGRVTSGYGDWGGGFERSSTSPLKITIDRDHIIHKVDTDSFYNSKESKRVEKGAIKIKKKLKIGKKLIIKNTELRKAVDSIFTVIPCKYHISLEPFRSPHMVDYFLNPEEHCGGYNLRNSNAL